MAIEATTVFCDDIRREDNGKAILIGVYTDDLVPSQIPITFPMSIWIKIFGVDAGTHPFEITMEFPGGSGVGMKGEAVVNDASIPMSLFMGGFPAEIKAAGLIKVTVEIAGYTVNAGELIVRQPRQSQQQADPAKEK